MSQVQKPLYDVPIFNPSNYQDKIADGVEMAVPITTNGITWYGSDTNLKTGSNLTVDNSGNLNIYKDNCLYLNNGMTLSELVSSPIINSCVRVKRATQLDALIRWNESSARWEGGLSNDVRSFTVLNNPSNLQYNIPYFTPFGNGNSLSSDTNFVYNNSRLGVGTDSPSAKLHVIQTSATDALRVDDQASDTTRFLIDQSGNVGIGVNTGASAILHINGNVTVPVQSNFTSSTSYGLYLQSQGASGLTSSGIAFGESSTVRASMIAYDDGSGVQMGLRHYTHNGSTLNLAQQIDSDANTSIIGNFSVNPGWKVYPPIALSSNNSTITTASYNNGSYITTESSSASGSVQGWRVFDKSSNGQWNTVNSYNNNTGSYIGAQSTTYNLTLTYTGEWVQIQIPNGISISLLGVRAGNVANSTTPQDFMLFGSNDGTNWTDVFTKTGETIFTSAETKPYAIYDTNFYTFFRFATNKILPNGTDQFLRLGELYFYGYQNTTPSLTVLTESVCVGTTTPSAFCILDVNSSTRAIKIPSLTTSAKTAITTPGAICYDSTLGNLSFRNSSQWIDSSRYVMTQFKATAGTTTNILTANIYYKLATGTISSLGDSDFTTNSETNSVFKFTSINSNSKLCKLTINLSYKFDANDQVLVFSVFKNATYTGQAITVGTPLDIMTQNTTKIDHSLVVQNVLLTSIEQNDVISLAVLNTTSSSKVITINNLTMIAEINL